MKRIDKDSAFFRAKHRVDRIKGFYSHLMVYIIVNIGISIYKVTRNMNNGETFNDAFFDYSTFLVWLVWGVGLAVHAFSVFGLPFVLGKHWEEEKIKQFMEEEEKNNIR